MTLVRLSEGPPIIPSHMCLRVRHPPENASSGVSCRNNPVAGIMSKTVRANALGRERRQGPSRLTSGTTDNCINAEARQWFVAAVEEDKIRGGTFGSERPEHIRRALPNGASARFIAFAEQTHCGRAAPGDIADRQLSSFVYARPCVVEEQ